jgi:hypothetical protein
MLSGLRGFWSRIFAVCVLAVPWALAWMAFNRKMLLLSDQPGTRALLAHPDAMMAIHKQSLEAQQHLWFYVVLCVVLPAIYVSLVELLAYLIRLIFASVNPRTAN